MNASTCSKKRSGQFVTARTSAALASIRTPYITQNRPNQPAARFARGRALSAAATAVTPIATNKDAMTSSANSTAPNGTAHSAPVRAPQPTTHLSNGSGGAAVHIDQRAVKKSPFGPDD